MLQYFWKWPFPEILEHELFLNCILARPGTPIFIKNEHLNTNRKLSIIGDISCDPDSSFNPIPIYNCPTNWAAAQFVGQL